MSKIIEFFKKIWRAISMDCPMPEIEHSPYEMYPYIDDRGLTMFKYDPVECKVSKVVTYHGNKPVKKKDYDYVMALNWRNAVKKFQKKGYEVKTYESLS